MSWMLILFVSAEHHAIDFEMHFVLAEDCLRLVVDDDCAPMCCETKKIKLLFF